MTGLIELCGTALGKGAIQEGVGLSLSELSGDQREGDMGGQWLAFNAVLYRPSDQVRVDLHGASLHSPGQPSAHDPEDEAARLTTFCINNRVTLRTAHTLQAAGVMSFPELADLPPIGNAIVYLGDGSELMLIVSCAGLAPEVNEGHAEHIASGIKARLLAAQRRRPRVLQAVAA